MHAIVSAGALPLGWVYTTFLPSAGVFSDNLSANASLWVKFTDMLRHAILPVLSMSYVSLASWMRYQRSSMLEVIREDYIRTARAKGLSDRVVIYKHALKNALIPVITLFGLSLPSIFEGSFIIEYVFAWAGMGLLGVESVFQRDYPVIMGINMMAAILIILGNLLADILYATVDPRIRYD